MSVNRLACSWEGANRSKPAVFLPTSAKPSFIWVGRMLLTGTTYSENTPGTMLEAVAGS